MRHIDILMISEGLDYVTEEARSAFLRLCSTSARHMSLGVNSSKTSTSGDSERSYPQWSGLVESEMLLNALHSSE
jgi:hypothetical protein